MACGEVLGWDAVYECIKNVLNDLGDQALNLPPTPKENSSACLPFPSDKKDLDELEDLITELNVIMYKNNPTKVYELIICALQPINMGICLQSRVTEFLEIFDFLLYVKINDMDNNEWTIDVQALPPSFGFDDCYGLNALARKLSIVNLRETQYVAKYKKLLERIIMLNFEDFIKLLRENELSIEEKAKNEPGTSTRLFKHGSPKKYKSVVISPVVPRNLKAIILVLRQNRKFQRKIQPPPIDSASGNSDGAKSSKNPVKTEGTPSGSKASQTSPDHSKNKTKKSNTSPKEAKTSSQNNPISYKDALVGGKSSTARHLPPPNDSRRNLSVIKESSQEGASSDLTNQQYSAGMSQGGQKYNSGMSLRGQQYDASMSLRGQQYNAGASLRGQQYSAEASLRGQQYSAGASHGGYQYGAYLDGQQYGAGASLHGLQYGAGASLDGQQYGAGAPLDVLRYGAGAPLDVPQYSAGVPVGNLQYGAGASLHGQQYGAGASRDGLQYGAGASLDGLQYGTGASLDGLQYGAGATLDGLQYGTGASLDGLQYTNWASTAGQQYSTGVSLANHQYNSGTALASQQYDSGLSSNTRPHTGTSVAGVKDMTLQCAYCKLCGHTVCDVNGKVTCEKLLKKVCPSCNSVGWSEHTEENCHAQKNFSRR